jgi:hypothetical protein
MPTRRKVPQTRLIWPHYCYTRRSLDCSVDEIGCWRWRSRVALDIQVLGMGEEMLDGFRSYAGLAVGLTEAAAARAKDSALTVAAQSLEFGTRAPERIATGMLSATEDAIGIGNRNREIILGMVRTEVDRAVGRIGFVREEELAAVKQQMQQVERQLAITNKPSASSQKTDLSPK